MKKIKRVTANDMHELILDLSIDEYYKLFELMFNHIVNFICESEKLTKKYEKTIPPTKTEEKVE